MYLHTWAMLPNFQQANRHYSSSTDPTRRVNELGSSFLQTDYKVRTLLFIIQIPCRIIFSTRFSQCWLQIVHNVDAGCSWLVLCYLRGRKYALKNSGILINSAKVFCAGPEGKYRNEGSGMPSGRKSTCYGVVV